MNKLKISVVTVSYNAAETIEETIQSVVNQTYDNIEYIIIDGGSTDGTLDIIKKYADRLAYWVSEPDKGIYDAMNKGIVRSSGDYICFLNAGDVLIKEDTIMSVANRVLKELADVFYGDLVLSYSYGKYLSKPQPLNYFDTLFPFSHPASFVKNDILKTYKFDLKYKIVADYNLFYNLYKDGKSFLYLQLPIVLFEAEDGVSSKNILNTYKEVAKINGSINTPKFKLRYSLLFLKNAARKIIKMFFPKLHIIVSKRTILSKNYITKYSD